MRLRLAAVIWLVCAAALAPRHGVCSSAAQQLHRAEGRIYFPIGQEPPASSLQVTLTLDTGKQLRAYPHANGTFSLHGVPAGAHRLDSSAIGFSIPSARIDVAADGRVTAAYSELPEQPLAVPIELRALPVDYFDKVVPFNLIAFLKSPMGMMGVFMLFALFILPKLKVDPEEMKELTEAMKEKTAARGGEGAQRLTGSGQGPRTPGGAQQRGGVRSRK